MSENPLLSVVVPVYNAASFIGEALESIVSQTYCPIEIIVVDDGSTDGSAEVIRSFKGIRYVYQQNSGPGPARNLGLSFALGDYIGFHDADDICDLNRFMLQMEVLLKNPELEVVYTRIINFLDVNSETPTFFRRSELMKPRIGFVSSLVARASVFDKVGLFRSDLRIGEDIEWMSRAQNLNVCTASLIDILVQRRLHAKNISIDISSGHGNLFKILRAGIIKEDVQAQ